MASGADAAQGSGGLQGVGHVGNVVVVAGAEVHVVAFGVVAPVAEDSAKDESVALLILGAAALDKVAQIATHLQTLVEGSCSLG